jgi:hypothetical protein
MENIAQA